MSAVRAILLLGLAGCLAPARSADVPIDRDGDGQQAGPDCDDADPAVGPHVEEVCDGVDNDCDGLVDERLTTRGWLDEDGDGFGGAEYVGCEPPPTVVFVSGDCDDTSDRTHPGAPEGCDGVDRNCDGSVDTEGGPWHPDLDGDGFGDPAGAVTVCVQPAGYLRDDSDCDDSDATVHPGAPEGCDGIDRDCDGIEPPLTGPWYPDTDGDGFGDPSTWTFACSQPADHVADGSDCDDTEFSIHPGAIELCDHLDNNCDPSDDLLDGDHATCAVAHCAELQLLRPPATDGLYWIDPGGTGAFRAWCDMTREGGGWTLVYAYTFTDYGSFTSGSNAVTPIPSWPVGSSDQPVSTTAPLSESDFAAMDHALWSSIGDEFFAVSTIQDWVVCTEGVGSLTGPSDGTLSCTNVLDVAPACSGLAPTRVSQYGYGWSLDATSLFLYWDGSSVANWPTHDPCGLNQANQLVGVGDPRGALYFR